MRYLAGCLLVICILAACSGAIPGSPVSTMVRASPTLTPRSLTSTFTIPAPTGTFTATSSPLPAECDASVSYCIQNGYFFLARPIALPGTVTIDPGYPYGSTAGGTLEPHHGVEFYNGSGTPVLAAADGQVVAAADDSQTIYALTPNIYGNLVVLEHHFSGNTAALFTLYGHLSRVEVQLGQQVKQGDEIGLVGMTGIAVGSHLHFEVRQGADDYDSNRNPVLWLQPLLSANGAPLGVLAGRVEDGQGHPIHTSGVHIQYFPERDSPQAAAWQVETYAPEAHPVHGEDPWNENFTLGDLKPGDYRVSLIWGGKLLERWLMVEAGKITFIIIKVGP